MAKISNQTAYPAITPVAGDYLVLTDVSDSNKTKTVTVQAIADFVDGEVTLQEVLDASDVGVFPPTAVAIGNITLTGVFAAPAGANVDIKALGVNDDILLSAGATSGEIAMTGAGIDGDADAVSFTATANDLTLSASSGNILMKAADKAIVSANGSSYGAQPAGTTMLYNQNDDIIINASGGLITLGGTYPNRPTGIDIGPSDGDIDIWAFAGGTKINLTAAGGIDSLSVHNFAANNGITLDGVAGASGEVIGSEGPGSPLAWKSVSSLLSLPTSNLFTGDALNVPTATDKIKIDLAPAVGFPDIWIGLAGPNTLTLQSGWYLAAVTHPYGDANLSYGQDALEKPLNTGTFNTALGLGAVEECLSGSSNTGIGFRAGAGIQTADHNTLVGFEAGTGTVINGIGANNTAVGAYALNDTINTSATNNVAIGYHALGALTDSTANVGVGYQAGLGITVSNYNVAIGRDTLSTAPAGEGNTMVGDRAGRQVGGNNNTFVGMATGLGSTTGISNTIVGQNSQVVLFGDNNGAALGADVNVADRATALGQGTTAGNKCIALGQGATANIAPTGNPVLNMSLWATLSTAPNAHVFASNSAALAAGLNPGDIYTLDPTTVGLPAIGAGPVAGPAILAIVYA